MVIKQSDLNEKQTEELRDRFAIAALIGSMSNAARYIMSPDDYAQIAYLTADSMLAERANGERG